MTDPTPQQLTFADQLYRMLAAGRQAANPVVILVVSEAGVVKKIIEEKQAVINALTVLHTIDPDDSILS